MEYFAIVVIVGFSFLGWKLYFLEREMVRLQDKNQHAQQEIAVLIQQDAVFKDQCKTMETLLVGITEEMQKIILAIHNNSQPHSNDAHIRQGISDYLKRRQERKKRQKQETAEEFIPSDSWLKN